VSKIIFSNLFLLAFLFSVFAFPESYPGSSLFAFIGLAKLIDGLLATLIAGSLSALICRSLLFVLTKFGTI